MEQGLISYSTINNMQHPFSQQKGGCKKRCMKYFRDALYNLSGGEVEYLLKSYLTSRDGKQIMNQLHLEFTDKLESIIDSIKKLHIQTSKNEKYKILSIVSKYYSKKQLWDKGFKFSSCQFTRSKRSTVQLKKLVNKKDKNYKKEFDTFLAEHSYEAANRTILAKEKLSKVYDNHSVEQSIEQINNDKNILEHKENIFEVENDNKHIDDEDTIIVEYDDIIEDNRPIVEIANEIIQDKNISNSLKRKNYDEEADQNLNATKKRKYINVRYLDDTTSNLYYLFKKSYPDIKISKSTFFRNISNQYKKPSKLTDLCPICEAGREYEKKWKRLKQNMTLNNFNTTYINDLRSNIIYYKSHKKFIDIQRLCFNQEIKNIKSQHGVLVMDFKENLKLGGSPRELNQDFYHKVNCSILGMCLVYKDQNGEIRKEYTDFFSDILSHDGLFVKDCLNLLLSSDTFPKLKYLSIWSDNARHFHSKEIAYSILSDIPQKYSLQIQWNLFGEYHGKNLLDGHFGLLSRYIKEGEKCQNIKNKEECIAYLENQIRLSNNNKESLSTEKMKYPDLLSIKFEIYNREVRPSKINQLCFTDF